MSARMVRYWEDHRVAKDWVLCNGKWWENLTVYVIISAIIKKDSPQNRDMVEISDYL